MTDLPTHAEPPNSAPSLISATELPYLTGDLPGIGGILKQRIDDFCVDEIPAYAPEGSGEFVYLWVEKEGLSGEQLTSHLAKFLGIAHQDVGMAGLKDRQAIARQMVSVPVRCESKLAEIRHPQIRVLSAVRHRNKLRAGHLRGNRFSLLVRQVPAGALGRAEAIAERLAKLGFPNYFGDQRFGREAETAQLGFDLLHGKKMPNDIARARRKFLLRLALSAAQSILFNRALAARMIAGALHRVLLGDVMQVMESRGVFVVDDVPREQARFDAHEIVTTGPIFGPKMKAPTDEVTAFEAGLLKEYALPDDAFTTYGKLTLGTRRPYLVWPEDLAIEPEPDGLRLRFTLPAGCYATVLLREFQKC